MGLERPFMALQQGAFPQQYRRFVKLVLPGFWIVCGAVIIALMVPDIRAHWALVGGAALYVAMNVLVRAVRVAYITSRAWQPFVVSGIVTQLVIVAGAVLLALGGIDDPLWWIAVYIASGSAPLVLLVFSLRNPRADDGLPPWEIRSMRRQGIRLLPASLGNTAMVRSDRLLLPILGTSADLGIYVTVATVMEMATWPIQQWVDVSLRKWSMSVENVGAQFTRLIVGGIGLALAVSVSLGALTYVVVTSLLPSSYGEAVTVIVPLGIAAIFYSLTRIQQGVLIALGASGTVSLVETTGWIVAIASYVVLIPPFGIMGAAIGSIFGYAVCAVVGFVSVRLRLRQARA